MGAKRNFSHYSDVLMSTTASQITGVSVIYSNICSGRSKKTSKLRVTGLWAGISPVTGEFPLKGPIVGKMFPFDDGMVLNLNYESNIFGKVWP